MNCFGIFVFAIFAVIFITDVELLPSSYPEDCDDVPYKLVCACNADRCKYFGNDCLVEAYSDIYGKSEYNLGFFNFKQK